MTATAHRIAIPFQHGGFITAMGAMAGDTLTGLLVT